MSLPRLEDHHGATIDMACRRCHRFGEYDRKSLVKTFGAQIEYVEVRRRLAIGCKHAGTDKCEAIFPCLTQARITIERAPQ